MDQEKELSSENSFSVLENHLSQDGITTIPPKWTNEDKKVS